jgi:hypothetical protein
MRLPCNRCARAARNRLVWRFRNVAPGASAQQRLQFVISRQLWGGVEVET